MELGVAVRLTIRVYSEPKKDLLVAAGHQLHSAAHVPHPGIRHGAGLTEPEAEGKEGALLCRRPNCTSHRRAACKQGNDFSAVNLPGRE